MNVNAVADDKGGGAKADVGKVRMDLLPFDAIEEVAKVLTFGANKYNDRNWEKGMGSMRLIGAALRHMFSWSKGETYDQETGLHHLAHAVCCLLFILSYQLRGMTATDDRPGASPAADKRVAYPMSEIIEACRPEATSAIAHGLPALNRIEGSDIPFVSRTVTAWNRVKHGYSPHFGASTGTKTSPNKNLMKSLADNGDEILVCINKEWCWRVVRDVVNNMTGMGYRLDEVPGQSSILICPHLHIFAIIRKDGSVHVE